MDKMKNEMDKMNVGEGNYVCHVCLGTGKIRYTLYKRRCPKCLGSGKLDWIEKIVGKRNRRTSLD